MELLILLAQTITLLGSTVVLCLLFGAIPYAIGLRAGRKQALASIVEQSSEDKEKFDLWLLTSQIRRNRSLVSSLTRPRPAKSPSL